MARASHTLNQIYDQLPVPSVRTLSRVAKTGGHVAKLDRIHRPSSAELEELKPRVERAVFSWGLINPLLALPQVANIYVHGHVGGLSPVTISAALLMSLLLTAHGALTRQTAIWVTSTIWVVLDTAMLTGIVLVAN